MTGAGSGLGRSYAHLLGSRGAIVVVNDLGGKKHGGGQSREAADKVVQELRAVGVTCSPNYDDVRNGDKIVEQTLREYGRVDIIVNVGFGRAVWCVPDRLTDLAHCNRTPELAAGNPLNTTATKTTGIPCIIFMSPAATVSPKPHGRRCRLKSTGGS